MYISTLLLVMINFLKGFLLKYKSCSREAKVSLILLFVASLLGPDCHAPLKSLA
jgi:hypothetical protein